MRDDDEEDEFPEKDTLDTEFEFEEEEDEEEFEDLRG
jgi:hypothetical protein